MYIYCSSVYNITTPSFVVPILLMFMLLYINAYEKFTP